jgi:hypothetical protein
MEQVLFENHTSNNLYQLRIIDEKYDDGSKCKIYSKNGNSEYLRRVLTNKEDLYNDFISAYFNFKYNNPDDFTFEIAIKNCCMFSDIQIEKYSKQYNEYSIFFRNNDEYEIFFLEKLVWIIHALHTNEAFYENEFKENTFF